MKNIQKIKAFFLRNTYAFIAVELMFAVVLTALPLGHSSALGQLTTRSVTMSDSAPSGGSISSGVGSGTDVDYQFKFSVTYASTIGGIAIEFCTNSALSWDSCTAPTGFNTNWATTQIYNQTNLGTGAFSVYTTAGAPQVNNRIVITRATAATIPASSSFELGNGTTNGFTNATSAPATFYARMYTYDTAAHAAAHVTPTASVGTDDGFDKDFGAVALSTVNVITITARVQESLIFCVSAVAPGTNCASTTAPALSLGTGTAPNIILNSSAVYTGTVYSQLSTNAASGAIVTIHNSATGGGLATSGGSTIPPAASGGATAGAITAGTAAFGLYIAPGSGGTGSVTVDAPYATSGSYGMDSTSTNNVTTTFGDEAYHSTTPVNNVGNTWTFGATAANTTPAGLYTANISTIATGTF